MGLLIVDSQFIGIAQACIEQAKKEICISTFKLEINETPKGRALKNLFLALISRIKEGVKVRVLFNYHTNKHSVPRTNFPAGIFLKNAGADVRYLKNNRCNHSKLILIDKEKVILGSHNLSVRSLASNFELSYLIPDPETVAQVGEVFNSSFNGAEKI
jgi:phosphatidylserine/phosphatidylglycerophosphate/cardiolipin synthase-like enzyme